MKVFHKHNQQKLVAKSTWKKKDIIFFRKVLDITYFDDDHINLNKEPINDLEDQFSKEYFI